MQTRQKFPAPRILRLAVIPVVMAMLLAFLTASVAPTTALGTAQAAGTDPCAVPVTNAVACENSKPGSSPLDWYVPGTGDTAIAGYGTSMSVNAGDSIGFKVKTAASSYHVNIFRLGYYQGLGAREVQANVLPTAALPQTQPACQQFSSTGLIDCGNWAVSASWTVPATAVSGLYIAVLTRDDTAPTADHSGVSQIPFVVRNDSSTSDIVVQTSDETWQAYNSYGGNSLYGCTVSCPPGNPLAYKAAFKVSYNRPFFYQNINDPNWFESSEYPMIFFLEQNGYDLSYISGLDTGTKPALLANHKVFMSSGHDEYWSGQQRTNVENARDHGLNLAFFTGNEVFWRTRWEPSQAGATTPNRTLVAYKDTHFNAPTDPVEWTGTWRDPRFGTATGGGNPENALTGQIFLVNSGTTDITVPAAYAKQRLWRNTAASSLTGSQVLTLGSGLGVLGYEWDVDADDGFRPAGLIDMSSTTYNAPEVFTDYGSTLAPATATHHLTMYKAPSGALVFGSGTVQWSWGLSVAGTVQWAWGQPDGRPNTDKNMQQATINLLADMHSQPATLMASLVPASATADTTAPTSSITAPAPGTTVADGTSMTITGTSADSGGGVVAGVEVSTDNGTTWHPATGTTQWSYTWVAHGSPSATIRVRATDDSGNIEQSAPAVAVGTTCPCSVFGSAAPANADSGDTNAGEFGVKFTADTTGTVKGLRFYKSTANTGTHVGSLWSSTGTLLAQATFTNESSSGWQTVTFSTPVPVTASTVYVASYYAPKGHYSETEGYLYNNPSPMPLGSSNVDSGHLHLLRNMPGTANGLYTYAGSPTFPTDSFNGENYWVDVNFTPSAVGAPTVLVASPAANATNQPTSLKPTATFNQAVTPSSVAFSLKTAAGATTAGAVSYDSATNKATFTPSAALAFSTNYTATVSGATNAAGQAMALPYSWSFTTLPAPTPPVVTSVTPANGATGVPIAAAAAAKFDQAVTASSIQFTLKDPAGNTVPASAAYAAASNTVTLTPAQLLSYSTTYTATVSGATNSPGQSMAQPYTWTFSTVPQPAPPAVLSVTPATGATGSALGTTPTATFTTDVVPSSITMAVTSPDGSAVAGTTAYDSASKTAKFTPASLLGYGTTYTVTVSGAVNTTGQAMASPASWTFTTIAAPLCPCTVFGTNEAPATGSENDTALVELGMKFQSDLPGYITAIRFYKSTKNTGTHTGYLWSGTGSLLASVTFTNESATGWQQATLSTPVTVSPKTTYIVSYLAPNGGYAATTGYFASAKTSSPLTGLASGTDGPNGVFRYGDASFPTDSFNNANYWVDAVFSPTSVPVPRVTSTTPADGATGVVPSAPITAGFNWAVTPSTVSFTVKDSQGQSVAGSTSYDDVSDTSTFTPSQQLAYSAAYTATVSGASNAAGGVMVSSHSWTFTTMTAPACPCSVFSSTSTPGTQSANDPDAVELGMKFHSDVNGTVTGIKFYKGAQNTGSHTGYLWTSTGSLLGSVTFTNESAGGWQTASFATPIAIAANQSYIVSYFAPNGHYAADSDAFATAVNSGPLHAPDSETAGGNGVYRYGDASFPSDTFNATNYWVDVIFAAS